MARPVPRSRVGRFVLAAFAAGTALTVVPEAVAAQFPELPTLAGAGIEYISPSGFLQLSFSGRLDLEAIHTGTSWAGLVNHEAGEDPLPADRVDCAECHVGMGFPGEGGTHGAHRLRVLGDLFVGDHVYARAETRLDRGHVNSDAPGEARVEQLFVRLNTASGAYGVQLGRFASPFGGYVRRHLTDADPFLRPPLGHDYRTIMSRTMIVTDEERWLRWRDRPELFRKQGTPAVWDVPYPWGATAFGFLGPIEVTLSALNSTGSSGPAVWAFDIDRYGRTVWVATGRTTLTPALGVGASFHRGPWMERTIAGAIGVAPGQPAGASPRSFRSFDQEIVSVDVEYAVGRFTAFAEAMFDRWEVPNLTEEPRERIYSATLQVDVAAGLSLAGRVGHIDFRPIDDGLGTASPFPGGRADWDYDVVRYEASVGYRLSRNVGLLISGYRQAQDPYDGVNFREVFDSGDTSFVGARLWWAF